MIGNSGAVLGTKKKYIICIIKKLDTPKVFSLGRMV